MGKLLRLVASISSIILLVAATTSLAQQPPAERALTIYPPTGLPVIPVMEGWYDNDDGSVTISFGYHNRNSEGVLIVPFGEHNRIEPAEFDGVQPTFFDRGRQTGIFTITLPPDRRDESVWWHIKTGENEMFKVPGRSASEAYQLDRRPRPQGSVPPLVWFNEDGERSSGPDGAVTELGKAVQAGTKVTLAVHAMDPSIRDPNDPRFQEPIALRAVFAVHQGPAAVEFVRHETTQLPEPPPVRPGRPPREPPGHDEVHLLEGAGTAQVHASFTQPGQYLLRIQVDNFAAPESMEADQCCWTNVYQKINVVPAPTP
jgi:hypothetical protein